MAIQENPECLWDEQWIKNLMASFRDDTSSSTSPFFNPKVKVKVRGGNGEPRNYYEYAKNYTTDEPLKKPEEKKESLIFDPKELDLEDEIQT